MNKVNPPGKKPVTKYYKNKVTMAYMKAFTADQSRLLVDASRHYDQYIDLERTRISMLAWMSWRFSGKSDYLRQADPTIQIVAL